MHNFNEILVISMSVAIALSCSGRSATVNGEPVDGVQGNTILRDGRIGVRVSLDTVDTWLCFDTGFRGSLIVDREIIDSLYEPGDFMGTEKVFDRPILLDDKPLGYTKLSTMVPGNLKDEEEFQGSNTVGCYFDGCFSPDYGHDRRIWEINMDKRTISIHEKDTVPPNSAIFPLTLERNVLFVTIPMKVVKDGKTLELNRRMSLDYGNENAILLYNPDMGPDFRSFYFGSPHSENKSIETYGGDGVPMYMLLCDRIEMPQGLAPVEAADGDITFMYWPSPLMTRDSAFGDRSTVAFGLLRHYNSMIDLKNMRLILWNCTYTADTHISNIPVYMTNMGFWIDTAVADYVRPVKNVVMVVVSGMNAEKAGLQIGDKVLRINGEDVADMDRERIYGIFRLTPAGKSVVLDISRDGRPIQIKYVTDENPATL